MFNTACHLRQEHHSHHISYLSIWFLSSATVSLPKYCHSLAQKSTRRLHHTAHIPCVVPPVWTALILTCETANKMHGVTASGSPWLTSMPSAAKMRVRICILSGVMSFRAWKISGLTAISAGCLSRFTCRQNDCWQKSGAGMVRVVNPMHSA